MPCSALVWSPLGLATGARFRWLFGDVFLDLVSCFLYKTKNAIFVFWKKQVSEEVSTHGRRDEREVQDGDQGVS